MGETSGDYHRGEMDIHEQVSTYKAFLALSKWFSLALAVFLVWAVLFFVAAVGFIGASATGVVILALGIFFLRSKPQPH